MTDDRHLNISSDPASWNSIEASVTRDLSEEVDTEEEELLEVLERHWKEPRIAISKFLDWHQARVEEEARHFAMSDFVDRLLRYLLGANNIKLAAYGLAFAAGLKCLDGLSMKTAALDCRCTKAAISKVANQCSRELGLGRSKYMKSENACRQYSDAQRKKHWRHK